MAFKNYTNLNTKNANATTSKNDEVNTVAVQEHEASKLDLSYSHKTTFDVGKLVPIFQMQVMPGDVVDLDVRTLLKMSIPAGPTMDAPRYDINFFFVPWKQVFPDFENLIGTTYSGGTPEPLTSVPVINYSSGSVFGVNDLAAHMEVPIGVDMSEIGFNISALPFRAFIKVYNEWYRDENLWVESDWTNGNDANNLNVNASNYWINNSTNTNAPVWNNVCAQVGQGLPWVCRLKDYFSTCLPFIQKGAIPSISTLAQSDIQTMLNNVFLDGLTVQNGGGTYFNPTITDMNGNPLYNTAQNDNWYLNVANNTTNMLASNFGTQTFNGSQNAYMNLQTEPQQLGYVAQYSGAGAGSFNITDLRTAIVKQHQNELDARAGTRYYEKLLSYWGIETNPLEVGRTEFIGGWHDNVNISNVVQSAPNNSTANTPLGTVAGLSITTGQIPNKIHYAVGQYGIILGLVCVRTNITYSQGLPRLFTCINNFDFYNPTFNGISEQPVYKYELYLDENGTTNNLQVFGYNQPFAWLKYKPNVATGYLSANATDTYYTMYTYQNALSSSPTLSSAWIGYPQSALENTLLLNAQNQNENINDFIGDFYFDCKVLREIPAYSIPGVEKI